MHAGKSFKPGVSNIRPGDKNLLSKDSNLASWKSLKIVHEGINPALKCIFRNFIFPTEDDLLHSHTLSNR